jgi:hypothetical protein
METLATHRFLQPSPTLRWHPWAPLIAGLLLLVFAFGLGAWWGLSVGNRMTQAVFASQITGRALDQKARAELETSRPATALYWEARRIDEAILTWAARPPTEKSVLADLRDRADWMLFCFVGERARCGDRKVGGWGAPMARADLPVEAMRELAEYRLQNLGGAATRWQRTSSYCEETYPPAIAARDFREEYARVAQAYAKLLGRPVTAEQLAPAVEGWRCESKGKQP